MNSNSLDAKEPNNACLLSVVVSVYNNSDNLHTMLESISAQRIESIEVICIDDGSTDGSINVITDFVTKDSRFKAIFHEVNQGVHYVRLEGMALA